MIVVISMQLKGVAGLALRKTFERDIRTKPVVLRPLSHSADVILVTPTERVDYEWGVLLLFQRATGTKQRNAIQPLYFFFLSFFLG